MLFSHTFRGTIYIKVFSWSSCIRVYLNGLDRFQNLTASMDIGGWEQVFEDFIQNVVYTKCFTNTN